MVSPLRGETAPLCIRGGSAADTAADDGNGNGNGHDNGGELAPSAVPRLAVTFLRSESLGDGEALYISGDCDALGNLDPARAVPMKRAGGKRWTVEAQGIPAGTQYVYLAAAPGGAERRATTGYSLVLRAPAGAADGAAVVRDDTHQLVRFVVSLPPPPPGRGPPANVGVVGSVAALGAWHLRDAVHLRRRGHGGGGGGGRWEAVVRMPSEDLAGFKYKFVADGHFESGGDRHSDAAQTEPQGGEEFGWEGVTTLESVWEGLLLRFLIFHPLSDADERMVITGGHPGLGNWRPAEAFREMGLGGERTLLTGVRGRCWEASFPAPAEDYKDVQYRYVIVNTRTKTALWENEPNRHLGFIPGSDSTAGNKHQPRLREWRQFDGNFVAKELKFDWVPPCLFVGPYPQCAEDVAKMKAAGVTGVVNVQTDKDCMQRMVNMDMMQQLYNQAGIELARVPIEDFHGADLAARVKFGAHAVDRLMRNAGAAGREGKVYIHCTAGMGRAPAVACVYLVWKHGYSLESAMGHVKHHRPIVAPNFNAMRAALQAGID